MRLNKFVLTLFTIFLFIIFFYLSVHYYSGDVKNHRAWGQSLLDEGPLGFYERKFPGYAFPNYPPLAMLSFAGSLRAYNGINQIVTWVNSSISIFPSNFIYFFQSENVQIAFLKLPAILSNFGIFFAVFLLLGKIKSSLGFKIKFLFSSIFLFNPATFYLSVVWGQIDTLPLMFLLFSMYFVFKKKFIVASTFSALALLSKQTVIIFLPVIFLMIIRKSGWSELLKSLLVVLVIFYLSYIPFNNLTILWPFEIFQTNFEMVAKVTSVNSFNLWGAFFDFKEINDSQIYFGLSFQLWGYILFILFMSVPSLFFLKREINIPRVLKFILLISLAYFFFLTRMHERYLIAPLVLLPLISAIDKKYWIILAFFSIVYLLNLYRGLYQPDINGFNYLVKSFEFLKILVVGYFAILIYLLIDFLNIKKNAS